MTVYRGTRVKLVHTQRLETCQGQSCSRRMSDTKESILNPHTQEFLTGNTERGGGLTPPHASHTAASACGWMCACMCAHDSA